MQIPETLNDKSVSKCLEILHKANEAHLEFLKRTERDFSDGGLYGFLYNDDHREHLVKSLKVPGGFKKKREEYYADLPMFETVVRPFKKDFDPWLKLFCEGISNPKNLSDEDIFQYFEACVAVSGDHRTDYNISIDGPVKKLFVDGAAIVISVLLVIGGLGVLAFIGDQLEKIDIERPEEKFCKQYKIQNPGATQQMCDRAWKAIKEWDE